ncbi:hypothetical protein HCX48_09495 [Rhodocyclus tenuis]|uniref:Phasin family protein n=2 Tax=Rhodocyclus TaxID=1064 RepID=A0A6L5JY02_RHOTE|nr:hypothetical protein [Rhodocyclus gracilis]MQY52109.1 hypothetical protein [Rhodocyclus gracilis]NJA89453.1 hypothetical protein [Rhodocyclus gracilis]
MRTATLQHFEAFQQIASELVALAPKYAALGENTLAITQHNVEAGNLDGAVAASVTAFDFMTTEYQRLTEGFQKATMDLLGERPAAGENPMEFVIRILSMTAEQWGAMARKNGVALLF